MGDGGRAAPVHWDVDIGEWKRIGRGRSIRQLLLMHMEGNATSSLDSDAEWIGELVKLIPYNVFYAENKENANSRKRKAKELEVEEKEVKVDKSRGDKASAKTKKKRKSKGKKKKFSASGTEGSERPPTDPEIEQKLHEKIESLRKGRKADDGDAIRKRVLKREKKAAKSGVDSKGKKKDSDKPTKVFREENGDGEREAQAVSEDHERGSTVDDLNFTPITGLEREKRKRITSRKKKLEKALSIAEKTAESQVSREAKLGKILKRSRGDEVLDDPKRIKKSLTRIQKKKERSQKKWADRTKEELRKSKEKQQKREANLRERSQNKKSKNKRKGRS